MIHSSTFVEQQMLQLLFNKCWTAYHVMLNVEICNTTCWKLLNKNRAWLCSTQQVAACCHLLSDVNQPFFQFRDTWLCGKIQHGGLKINLCSKRYGRPFFSWYGNCVLCVHLLAWWKINVVSNWESSFKDVKSMWRNFCKIFTSTFCMRSTNRAWCIVTVRNFFGFIFLHNTNSCSRLITTFHRPPFSKYGVVAQQKLNEYSTSRNLVQHLLFNKSWTMLKRVSLALLQPPKICFWCRFELPLPHLEFLACTNWVEWSDKQLSIFGR